MFEIRLSSRSGSRYRAVCRALKGGASAGDGRVGSSSCMATGRPSPSVMRGASPMTLYGPKVADWGQRGCFRDRRRGTKSRFAGDGRVRGARLTRPTRAPPSVTRGGAMGVANERLVGLAVRELT